MLGCAVNAPTAAEVTESAHGELYNLGKRHAWMIRLIPFAAVPSRVGTIREDQAFDGGVTSRRRIFPVGPFGRESTSHTLRGYL